MFNNLINSLIAGLVAGVLYACYDVPMEEALTVGLVAIVAYTLGDISRHLRKATQ